MSPLRLLLAASAALAAACAAALPAPAARATCGTNSYSYAGVTSVNARYGVAATIATVHAAAIASGHVAAWTGVGGYGLGPNGTNEWLQAGIVQRAGQAPALYYEVALPNTEPRYVMLKGHLPAGRSYRVAVLESRHHPDFWRVWVNGTPLTKRIHLPGSHGAWRPVATAESWTDDGTSACNSFSFRFSNIVTADRPGGSWSPMVTRVLADPGYRVLRESGHTLLAYGG